LTKVVASLLFLCTFAAGKEADSFGKLQIDPSSDASRRLAALYRNTPDPDQRLWILHALALRLGEKGDDVALEALLEASKDKNASLRGQALTALAGFSGLPRDRIRPEWLGRLDAAASTGMKDRDANVHRGALELQRAVREWRRPAPEETTPQPEWQYESGVWPGLVRNLKWLWLLLVPGCFIVWIVLGAPVLDAGCPEGCAAARCWETVKEHRVLLVFSALGWLILTSVLGVTGFDILARSLGWPLYGESWNWLGSYFICGLCVFLPGALVAAGSARKVSMLGQLGLLPAALAAALAAFFLLVPLEILYRLFLRRPRVDAKAVTTAAAVFDTLLWVLETGTLRSCYLAMGVVAAEGLGLAPALGRCREVFDLPGALPARLSLSAYDSRFILLCAAPLLACACGLMARGLPVQWHVSALVVLAGCVLWSWAVLAGVLFAFLQPLEGAHSQRRSLESNQDRCSE